MADLIDLFGNRITEEPTPPALDPLDANLWKCTGCGGEFPASIEPDIIVLDDPTIKFCTDACAEFKGMRSAADTYRRAYTTYGYTSVEVTTDGRLPDARSARDLEQYGEAIVELIERETYTPSFLATPPPLADLPALEAPRTSPAAAAAEELPTAP